MVGLTGFEPATPDTPCNCQVDPSVATGLVDSMANAMKLAELEEIDNRMSKLEAITNG
ncbi:hypothetical protein [Psychrosphaera algicola]|uniref:Uncharacterized protein n=1 Tax=Psychrosphaera algicola TaxID=3023714 RepID=A0ABT5FBV3_9GAMM|nr:hypothetical protein [Psychrosphaera sp. G1-22]MDC2888519.1 hypothetical protein [Psychrosphaera sp. G1-22]